MLPTRRTALRDSIGTVGDPSSPQAEAGMKCSMKYSIDGNIVVGSESNSAGSSRPFTPIKSEKYNKGRGDGSGLRFGFEETNARLKSA